MSAQSAASDLIIRPCGDSAFIIELGDLERVLAMHAQLAHDPHPGQLDVLAAATTVMVQAASPSAAIDLAAHVRTLSLDHKVDRDDTLVEIEVVYDGEDLADVAHLVGLSIDGVIAAHTGQLWTAAFGGFSPGFVYCIGENHILDVPRRPSPRTMVPAGAVGLAGHFSAVYPRNTPGGWQLIGHAQAPMWDANREKPALVAPGNRVRYLAVREFIEVPPPPASAPTITSGLRVVATGLQTVVTDLGRSGHADLGVPESGAMDRRAASSANALAGNPRGFAVLENLDGGLVLQAVGDQVLAVTGADVPLTVTPPTGNTAPEPSSRPPRGEYLPRVPAAMPNFYPPCDRPFALMDGATLKIGPPRAGVRAYVGVRGGLDLPLVLGSAASDLLSGEGPAPLKVGDVLPVKAPAWPSIVLLGDEGVELPGDHLTVHITLGPRDDWFDNDQVDSLLSQRWVVTDRSNRIGLRLDGTPLLRNRVGELPSEGVVAGGIQMPAEGLPVVFMRDHPVTGGYPVIGVIDAADLDGLAQLAPGATLGFTLEEDA